MVKKFILYLNHQKLEAMKTNFTFSNQFKSLILSLVLIFSWGANAAAKNEEKSYSSSLSLTVTHGKKIDLNQNVSISFSIDENTSLKSVLLKTNQKQIAIENNSRTKSRGDGKIDVDIIIKISLFNELFKFDENNIPNKPYGYKQILDGLDLILITVDNISGVFANAPSGPGDVRIAVIDDINSSTGSNAFEVTASLIKPSSEFHKLEQNKILDFTVFPTPSYNQEVSISIPEEVKVNTIQIFNSLGVMINSEINSGNAQLLQVKLNTEQKGIYFARLQTSKGEFVQKIILR
jgi:hypothetical protein